MNLEKLLTESRNPDTLDIDRLSTLDVVTKINSQDQLVPLAVSKVLPQIAQAVDWIVAAMDNGGRLFYLGAGTSGRLGILDASECPPTFGTPAELVQGLIAGGETAVFRAVEGAEDSLTLAAQDLTDRNLSPNDIVVGIAASGRTPYVIGGLSFANKTGCHTVALVCSPNSEMAVIADLTICVEAGPEVIMGSTRLKAGTAQKLVLNMLTTATMIRRGKVYSNLMVDVQATNKKLIERAKRIVSLATGATREQVEAAIEQAGGSAKVAIVMILAGLSAEEATVRLEHANGFVAKAIR
ncbi:N-acetylmuramic acid 6-phosphate etherase [Anaerosporomusa subterranea]|uniref:N-acetylmuramic acid 6-phosphate etherase n=1 Tax=Anaerosporomusa subterranea TaxID=1794912 RepID=A0A154BRJ5_ANASB|nr:N-acetylmuramic acid 6-phosphate etherase [Anaerosporomusa subterranea]KYZ76440.1 N-acetylmuramic acid 6-phosphate etherase [Anaerosporomusa subterranea]